jgi:hypothetical protein
LREGLRGARDFALGLRGLEGSRCARRFSIKQGVFGSMTDAIDSIIAALSNAPIRELFRVR